MLNRKLIILCFLIISYTQLFAQKKEAGYLYHQNGTVAYDSSFHIVYYENKVPIFNPLYKAFMYKNKQTIYEVAYDNLYYPNGAVACNGHMKKVFYENGVLAYDGKNKIVYDTDGKELLNFSKSSKTEYEVKSDNLSILISPSNEFKYKLEVIAGEYKYVTDFKNHFKILNKASGKVIKEIKLK